MENINETVLFDKTLDFLQDQLNRIQKELKAPKNQRNNFGNYNYRSCEDILESIKPLLGPCVLTITDDIINLGNRFYVKSTASIQLGENRITVSAYAREAEVKKGMDESQITGSASSYARKYALNGLFCIDDTKDADTRDNSKNSAYKPIDQDIVKEVESFLSKCKTTDDVKEIYNTYKGYGEDIKQKIIDFGVNMGKNESI